MTTKYFEEHLQQTFQMFLFGNVYTVVQNVFKISHTTNAATKQHDLTQNHKNMEKKTLHF